jgi:hypothetical protein
MRFRDRDSAFVLLIAWFSPPLLVVASALAGRWFCYHRKTKTPIKSEFGTPEFSAELAEIERRPSGSSYTTS